MSRSSETQPPAGRARAPGLALLALLALLAVPQAGPPAARPPANGPFVDFEAGPGTRFSVLEAKQAPKESLFAFVPTSLLDDAAGQTQMAHVLEHMLIRSTEKEGLSDGEITFNGETNEVALRLEVFAPPKLAQAGLKKLLGWLQATEFDAAVLEAEKQKIAAEIESTGRNGFTHKWAIAAWNQVARRGRSHAAVRGDVTAATAEQVEAAADDRVDLSKVRIVAVGPLPVAAVKSLAQQELAQAQGLGALAGGLAGATAKRHEAEAAKRARDLKPLASGELEATWDLQNGHALAWFLLPNATADDAAAALVLSLWIGVRLQADPDLKARKIVAIASSDAVVPEGRVVMLSASLPVDADLPGGFAACDRAFDAAVAQLFIPSPQLGLMEEFLKREAAELGSTPDFQTLRRQLAGRPGLDLLEAQVALNLAMRELSSNHTSSELAAAVGRLTKAKLEALAKERLAPKRRSTLHLRPKG
jgi:predicted Zn-dependent peptidase